MLNKIISVVILGLSFGINAPFADETKVLIKPNVIQKLEPLNQTHAFHEMKKIKKRRQDNQKKHFNNSGRPHQKADRKFFKH